MNGERVNPQSATNIVFFLKKQNALEWKNMYFDEKISKICFFGTVLCFRLFWIFFAVTGAQNLRTGP